MSNLLDDFQVVLGEVEAILTAQAASEIDFDAAREVAHAYAVWCQRSNERLHRCLEYLYRGMPSAATHLAGVDPPLLELITALGAFDVDRWLFLCHTLNLPLPPRLLTAGVKDLERSATEAAPAEALFARYRTLALAKAPLRQRLEVLRQIAAGDKTNPLWHEDLSRFESARLTEISTEIEAAFAAGNLSALDDLSVELATDVWQSPLAGTRRPPLIHRLAQARLGNQQKAFAELLPQLSAARQAEDPDRCEALIAAWREAWPASPDRTELQSNSGTADIQSTVEELDKWVASQRQRTAREHRVQRAQSVLQEDAERQLRQRRVLKLLTLAAGIAITATTFAWWLFRHH